MSKDAPWLALSVDWMDSEMFDGATDGERLAWIALLCHAKRNGRAGRVRFRKSALIRDYSLSDRAVTGMLERAQKCAAIEIEGDLVSVCNWRVYQQKAYRNKEPENVQNGFLTENRATNHQSPSTHHQAPSTDIPPTPRRGAKKFVPPQVDEVESYIRENHYSVDAQQFVDHYTAKGWVVGKSPMKDWKAAVRTWERNRDRRQDFGTSPSHAKRTPPGAGGKPAYRSDEYEEDLRL